MDPAALHEASARELACYRDLAGAYAELAELLEGPGPADATRLAAADARAGAATVALRALAARLAPWRLGAEPVARDVRDLWAAAAALAAEAAAANGRLLRRARERQAAIRARLGRTDQGRRALRAYRPAGAPRAAVVG
jgi:hypothetical protein